MSLRAIVHDCYNGALLSWNCKNIEKRRLSEQNSRMEHIPKILGPVVLGLQNFPGPLTLRIWNCMQKSWDWKLLSKILRHDREISSFLWKYFTKKRLAIFARFHPRFVLEKYCCTTEKAISVSTSHICRATEILHWTNPWGHPEIMKISKSSKIENFNYSQISSLIDPWRPPAPCGPGNAHLYGLRGAEALECKRFRARRVRGDVRDL